MRRGDIVTVVAPGDYGKPRPAVIVQSDWFEASESVLVCLITSTLRDAPAYRVTVTPAPSTGLRLPSQVQVDKIIALRRDRIGPAIGRLPPDVLAELDRRLAFVIGLAG